jgi:hypothetical protein
LSVGWKALQRSAELNAGGNARYDGKGRTLLRRDHVQLANMMEVSATIADLPAALPALWGQRSAAPKPHMGQRGRARFRNLL